MTNEVILCVDDENIVLQSIKTELILLFNQRFVIEIAESGPEALAIFTEFREKQYEIPIVISDYIMPGMKGDELLKQVHRISPQTRTILLTGQAKLEGITNAINHANLFYYLEKPWRKEELKSIVDQAIDQYRQNKTLESEHLIQSRDMAALQAELQQTMLQLQDIKETLTGRDNPAPVPGKSPGNLPSIQEIQSALYKIKSNIDSYIEQNNPEVGQPGFDATAQEQFFRLNREEIERIASMINHGKEGRK